MPRGRKPTTATGAPGQPVESFEGQGFGDGVAQEALQAVMPSADRAGTSASSPSPPAGVPAQSPPVDVGALLAQAPTGMLGGTESPNQPITAGLSTGPGAGPEALQNMRVRTPLRRTLDTLSERTGDRMFRDLAERAGL